MKQNLHFRWVQKVLAKNNHLGTKYYALTFHQCRLNWKVYWVALHHTEAEVVPLVLFRHRVQFLHWTPPNMWLQMTTVLRRDCIILSAGMVIVFTRGDNDIIFMGNKKDVIISSCFVAIYIYITVKTEML